MTDDNPIPYAVDLSLAASLRAIDARHVVNRPAWTIAKCHEAADRIEALEKALQAIAEPVIVEADNLYDTAKQYEDQAKTRMRLARKALNEP